MLSLHFGLGKTNNGDPMYWRIAKKHLRLVIKQNSVNLVNGIFFVVFLLLLLFGEVRESLFLFGVLALNIAIGIVQDLRAKVALERLQILTAPKIVRVKPDGKEETIKLDDIEEGDKLKLGVGDQIPADGELVESNGLEVNEALITGESEYVKKKAQDNVLAASIVMAGSALLKVSARPKDSYVSRMTEKIKKYQPRPSPIQQATNAFIKYMTYVLLAIILYVIAHGLTVNDLFVAMIRDIGALTGTLVPQGLVLSTTVLFAYGALMLSKKHVLIQEISAAEKLGRIKQLCLDKTGTLTANKPAVEAVVLYQDAKESTVAQIVSGYIQANSDTSEVARAIGAKMPVDFEGKIVDALPFCSSRKYGAVRLKIDGAAVAAVMGAPEVLLDRLADENDRRVIADQVDSYAGRAKRLVLLTAAESPFGQFDPEKKKLRPLALLVLTDPLRKGVERIVKFFQDHDVRVRIISGDSPKTVQAVACRAGIKYTDLITTGPEMENWDEIEYKERVPAFHLFARVSPAQKEKIIAVLKKNGFTAMVGDGANDALAIKKSDLGIAMFDADNATRQIAQIVLTDNSFSALPRGIGLAGEIITTIELIASVFLNKVVVGLILFVALAFIGYSYPLSPSNITFVNLFTLWLPITYWTALSTFQREFDPTLPYSKKVLFPVVNGILTAAAAVIVFLLEPGSPQNMGSNIFVVIALIALGYWYFILAPLNYGIAPSTTHRRIINLLAALIAVTLAVSFYTPSFLRFFELQRPSFVPMILTMGVVWVFGLLQYLVAINWFYRRPEAKET